AVVPSSEIIESSFMVPFFAGKLLIDVVVTGSKLAATPGGIGRNLFAKRQIVVPRHDCGVLVGDQPSRTQVIPNQVARCARRSSSRGRILRRKLSRRVIYVNCR